jgi:hypothetical protein
MSTRLIKASHCSVQTIRVLYNGQDPECSTRDFSSTEVSMRLCRFGKNRLGLVRADSVLDVTPVLDRPPSYRYPLPRHDQRGAAPEGEYSRSDHRCAGLIAFATSFYTLMPGEVPLTGTPEGSAPSEGATSYDRQSPASVK